MSRFKSVAIDVDSTLCGVEGIDWLAGRKEADVALKVADLTARAMDGSVGLEAVYGERLALVAPTRESVAALGDVYLENIAPGAPGAIRRLLAAGVEVHLISGGLRPPVVRVAELVSVPPANVHAVEIYFDGGGSYVGYDAQSPLTRQSGKREVLEAAGLTKPALMAGDGMTDAEAAPAVQAFAAFTGFVARPQVIARADHVVSNFDELLELVMG